MTSGVGALKIWTQANGLKDAGGGSVAGLFAASEDGTRVAYSTGTTAQGLTNPALGNTTLSPAPAIRGQDLVISGSFVDPDANSWTGQVDFGDDSPPLTLTLNADKTFTATHAYGASGNYVVTITVEDSDGGVGIESKSVTVIPAADCALSGTVWVDFNDDGQVDFGEKGISGVAVTLSGTDDLGATTMSKSPTAKATR